MPTFLANAIADGLASAGSSSEVRRTALTALKLAEENECNGGVPSFVEAVCARFRELAAAARDAPDKLRLQLAEQTFCEAAAEWRSSRRLPPPVAQSAGSTARGGTALAHQ